MVVKGGGRFCSPRNVVDDLRKYPLSILELRDSFTSIGRDVESCTDTM